jgi:hypothetical protein
LRIKLINEIQAQKRDLDLGHDEWSVLYDSMTNRCLSDKFTTGRYEQFFSVE